MRVLLSVPSNREILSIGYHARLAYMPSVVKHGY